MLGGNNSSNSKRLCETAKRSGCKRSIRLSSSSKLDWRWLENVTQLGIISGASTPERLVEQLVDDCRARFNVEVEELRATTETVEFKLPSMG